MKFNSAVIGKTFRASTWLTCNLMFLATIPPAMAQDMYAGINKLQIKCIIDNVDSYINTGRPIVVIRPAMCPETSIFKSGEGRMENMLPGKTFFETKKEKDSSPTIVYTSKQLGCLKALAKGETLNALPRRPCQR